MLIVDKKALYRTGLFSLHEIISLAGAANKINDTSLRSVFITEFCLVEINSRPLVGVSEVLNK